MIVRKLNTAPASTRGEKPLSVRQQRFVAEFAVLGDVREAALRAGYAEAGAEARGRAMLARADVAEAVALAAASGLADVQANAVVTPEWVVARLKEVAERCMQAAPVAPARGAAGGDASQYKFDAGAAIRALGLLGKHLRMFTDRDDAGGDGTHETALDELE